MAGAVNLSEVDFKQIKDNLVNYLKSTEKFTDYDFEGSNLSVILNLIAYQAQLNSYSTNMIANESFLSTASIRNNVTANARQIGYLPTSARSATSLITFDVDLGDQGSLQDLYPGGLPQYLELRPGPAFTVTGSNTSFTFNVIDTQTAAVDSNGACTFENVQIYEGLVLTQSFTYDEGDFYQRFILNNINIDTSTLRVDVEEDPNDDSTQSYTQANNLTTIDENSRVYWVEEVQESFYELTFGDGLFGKKLTNGAKINVSYVVTNGDVANGIRQANNYVFRGNLFDFFGTSIITTPTVIAATTSDNGAQPESVSSIKFRAPKSYGAQNRCVTPQDYEVLIRNIYPGVDDMYVYGGETLEIPEFGRVYIVIKPRSGEYLSNSTKAYIKSSLNPYRVASIDLVFSDPDILYVEADSVVYYDDKKTKKDSTAILADVKSTLIEFSESTVVAKFGGSIKYSRIIGAIDDADQAITRNVTNMRMRKNMIAAENTSASYEICFENKFKVDYESPVVYSTGFLLPNDDKIYYFENEPQQVNQSIGKVRMIRFDEFGEKIIVNKEFGEIDYDEGEIKIGYQNPVTIASTIVDGAVVEVRAIPESSGKDIKAAGRVFLSFDVAKSSFAALIDSE